MLWIGTDNGLDMLDPVIETFTHYQNEEKDASSLSNDIVRTIYEDSQDTLWIGTHGGLNKFDRSTRKFIRYQDTQLELNSLSDNTVFYVTEDNQKTL